MFKSGPIFLPRTGRNYRPCRLKCSVKFKQTLTLNKTMMSMFWGFREREILIDSMEQSTMKNSNQFRNCWRNFHGWQRAKDSDSYLVECFFCTIMPVHTPLMVWSLWLKFLNEHFFFTQHITRFDSQSSLVTKFEDWVR